MRWTGRTALCAPADTGGLQCLRGLQIDLDSRDLAGARPPDVPKPIAGLGAADSPPGAKAPNDDEYAVAPSKVFELEAELLEVVPQAREMTLDTLEAAIRPGFRKLS